MSLREKCRVALPPRDSTGEDDSALSSSGDGTTDVVSTKPVKRLFSDRSTTDANAITATNGSAQVIHAARQDEIETDLEDDTTLRKRRRSSEWPLSTQQAPSAAATATATASRARRHASRSPKARARRTVRSSKFLEGSMNDRVSQRPPVPYIGDEEDGDGEDDVSQQHGLGYATLARGRVMTRDGTAHRSSVNDTQTTFDKAEARQSGLFRFGKSLAASFNPSRWKIWGKHNAQPFNVVEETPEEKILRERKEKAEAIYQQIKATGNFRAFMHGAASNVALTVDSDPDAGRSKRASSVQPQHRTVHEEQPTIPYQDATRPSIDSRRSFSQQHHARASSDRDSSAAGQPRGDGQDAQRRLPHINDKPESKHDSGVSFGADQYRRSYDAHDGRRNGRIFLEAPRLRESMSPSFSDASSTILPKRRSFNFVKPSFSAAHKSDVEDDDATRQARRMPSKKDLQKQQRLVKKVSDLEGKLLAAKRELEHLDQSKMPAPARAARKKFVPGALATLPSERLLSEFLGTDSEGAAAVEKEIIGQAVTTDETRAESTVTKVVKDEVLSPVAAVALEHMPQESEVTTQATCAMEDMKERSDRTVERQQPASLPDSTRSPGAETVPDQKQQALPGAPSHVLRRTGRRPRKRKSLDAEDGVYRPTTDADSDSDKVLGHAKSLPKSSPRPAKIQKKQSRSFNATNTITSDTTARVAKGSPSALSSKSSQVNQPIKRNTTSTSKVSRIPRRPDTPPQNVADTLDYVKPSKAISPPANTKPNALTAFGPIPKLLPVEKDYASTDIATLLYEEEVPPVPVMPKTVRLASGEVISTTPVDDVAMSEKITTNLPAPAKKPQLKINTKTRRVSSRRSMDNVENRTESTSSTRAGAKASAASEENVWPDYVF